MRAILSFLQKYFSTICYSLQMIFAFVEYYLLDFYWALRGFRKPSEDDVALVVSSLSKDKSRLRHCMSLFESIIRE